VREMDERIGYEPKRTKEQEEKVIHLLKHGTSKEVVHEVFKQMLGVDKNE